MTSLELARLQFGVTTVFHFIFVPLTPMPASSCSTSPRRTSTRRRPRPSSSASRTPCGIAACSSITHSLHGLERFDDVLELRDGRIESRRPSALAA